MNHIIFIDLLNVELAKLPVQDDINPYLLHPTFRHVILAMLLRKKHLIIQTIPIIFQNPVRRHTI